MKGCSRSCRLQLSSSTICFVVERTRDVGWKKAIFKRREIGLNEVEIWMQRKDLMKELRRRYRLLYEYPGPLPPSPLFPTFAPATLVLEWSCCWAAYNHAKPWMRLDVVEPTSYAKASQRSTLNHFAAAPGVGSCKVLINTGWRTLGAPKHLLTLSPTYDIYGCDRESFMLWSMTEVIPCIESLI